MFRSNTFSGGSDGTTITTGNSGGVSGDAFSTVSGSPAFEVDNASGFRGPMTGKFTTTSDRVRFDSFSLAARDVWMRQYMYITANPSAETITTFIAQVAGTNNLMVLISTSGKLVIHDVNSVQVGITSASVNTNAWFRVEVFTHTGTTTSNGSFEARLYNSPDSFTATETISGSGLDLSTSVPDRVSFACNTGFTSYQIDDVAITDTDWIGPSPYGNPTNPRVSTAALVRSSTW